MLQVPLKNIISLSEARHNFSKLIDKAMKNESFLITRGGKPVVVITGIEMIEQLYRQGIIATDVSENASRNKGGASGFSGIPTSEKEKTESLGSSFVEPPLGVPESDSGSGSPIVKQSQNKSIPDTNWQ